MKLTRNFLNLKILAVGFVILGGCSPQVSPPSLNSPVVPVNVEACRNAQLNLKHLDAGNVRGLVNCLNGNNNALKPYKDFLDTVEDSDLDQILEVYNRHVYGINDHRLNKTLDLIDRMATQGLLKGVIKDVQVLIETGVIQSFLPLLARIFEHNLPGHPDPDFKNLNRFLVTAIDQNLLSPVIVAGANGVGGLRARVLAILLSSINPNSVMNSDQVTDLVADLLLNTFDDGTLHAILSEMSDPMVARTLKGTTDVQIEGFSDLLSFLSDRSTEGSDRLNRMRLLVRGADQPLHCYKANGKSRQADNLLKFISSEGAKRAGFDGDKFFLETVPLLLAATKDSCDYSPELMTNLDVLTQAAQEGYGDGLRGFMGILSQSSRFEILTVGMKSAYMPRLGPLVEEMSRRGALPFLFQILAQDMTDSDLNHAAILLNHFIADDLSGSVLENWIKSQFASDSLIGTRDVLLSDLQRLAPGQKSLTNLSLVVMNSSGQDQTLKNLKRVLAGQIFPASAEQSLVNIGRRIFVADRGRRQELKTLSRALVVSLADSRGGLGDLMGGVAKATGLSWENPVQQIIRDTLADEALMDALTPAITKYLVDPRFVTVIEFSGRLASNGQLERLITFLTELFKSSHEPGLLPDPPPDQFKDPLTDPQDVIKNYHPSVPHRPPGDYSSCLKVNGSLFDQDNLYWGLTCLNADGHGPEFSKLANDLKNSGSLQKLSAILKTSLVDSPYTDGTMNELETLFKSGDLAKLLSLFVIANDSRFGLPLLLEPILIQSFSSAGAGDALKWVARAVQADDGPAAALAAAELLSRPPTKVFSSDNAFRLKVKDPQGMINKIKARYPDWSNQKIVQAYQVAAENFETHNDAWLYEEGQYPRLGDKAFKDEIMAFLRDTLRNTDLQEFISALQDLAANYDVVRFLSDFIDEQEVTVLTDFDGNPHIHIQTRFDQLENLVENGDFAFALSHNIGIDFQLAVVHSDDLSGTMRSQLTTLKLGLSVAKVFGSKEQKARFANMLENFDALQEAADKGYLQILRRLYKAFYKATPSSNRESNDPHLNHMYSLNHINNMGFFQQLSVALNSAKAQGEFEPIVRAVLNLVSAIGPQDIPALQNALTAMVSGNPSAVEVLLDKLLAAKRDEQSYKNLKDAMFHSAVGGQRFIVPLTGAIKSLPILATHPRVWNDLTDKVVQDAEDPSGGILTLGANGLFLEDTYVAPLKRFLALVLANDSTGSNFVPGAVSMLADGYEATPDVYLKFWQAFKAFKNDDRVAELQPMDLMKSIFSGFEGLHGGLGDGLAFVLTNDQRRQDVIDVGLALSRSGDISALSQILAQRIASGDVDQALHFIFDNLKPGSLQSNKRRH